MAAQNVVKALKEIFRALGSDDVIEHLDPPLFGIEFFSELLHKIKREEETDEKIEHIKTRLSAENLSLSDALDALDNEDKARVIAIVSNVLDYYLNDENTTNRKVLLGLNATAAGIDAAAADLDELLNILESKDASNFLQKNEQQALEAKKKSNFFSVMLKPKKWGSFLKSNKKVVDVEHRKTEIEEKPSAGLLSMKDGEINSNGKSEEEGRAESVVDRKQITSSGSQDRDSRSEWRLSEKFPIEEHKNYKKVPPGGTDASTEKTEKDDKTARLIARLAARGEKARKNKKKTWENNQTSIGGTLLLIAAVAIAGVILFALLANPFGMGLVGIGVGVVATGVVMGAIISVIGYNPRTLLTPLSRFFEYLHKRTGLRIFNMERLKQSTELDRKKLIRAQLEEKGFSGNELEAELKKKIDKQRFWARVRFAVKVVGFIVAAVVVALLFKELMASAALLFATEAVLAKVIAPAFFVGLCGIGVCIDVCKMCLSGKKKKSLTRRIPGEEWGHTKADKVLKNALGGGISTAEALNTTTSLTTENAQSLSSVPQGTSENEPTEVVEEMIDQINPAAKQGEHVVEGINLVLDPEMFQGFTETVDKATVSVQDNKGIQELSKLGTLRRNRTR